MSLQYESKNERLDIENEVMNLKKEIMRTKEVKIGNRKFQVNGDVLVFEVFGTVSGWNIHIDGDRDKYVFSTVDAEDRTIMKIKMIKPGYIVAVGEEQKENRAVIVYKKEKN